MVRESNHLSRPETIRGLLAAPVTQVAPMLLGWELSSGYGTGCGSGIVTVRLTEVEAYAGSGGDAASHAYRGPTKRNAVMFGPPGHLYAYFIYGMHWCLNVVTGPAGHASAVLLRGGEVVAGQELARSRRDDMRRRRPTGGGDTVPLKDLARGPARLAAALGLDGSCTGVDLLDPQAPVRLTPPAAAEHRQIMTGPRVGITRDTDRPWRFWLAGEPTVSGPVSGRG